MPSALEATTQTRAGAEHTAQSMCVHSATPSTPLKDVALGNSSGSGALLPTRAQAELEEEEDDGVGGSSRGGRREEPRSVEEAGPLRVLYEGHDLLIVDKVRGP